MGRRDVAGGWWRRRRARRVDAPAKDHVFAAVDEQLTERLRGLRLPKPPSALRERDRRSYGDWLGSASGRNRWRG